MRSGDQLDHRNASGSAELPTESKHVAQDGGSLAAALHKYCSAQIKLVSEALQRRNHVYRGVHEARKGIRRLRSVIALGSSHFGETATRIDGALRRLVRSLSRVRDGQVAKDCALRKAKDAATPEQRALWQRITTRLASARTRTMRRARAKDPNFLKRQSAIERIGGSISMLPWVEVDPAMLRARLEQSRKRAGRAADCYLYEPRVLHLHQLRRRLRRYRMQITALTTILESPTSTRVTRKFAMTVEKHFIAFGRITRRVDQLGELLDTQLLRTAIRRLPASADRAAALFLLRQQN